MSSSPPDGDEKKAESDLDPGDFQFVQSESFEYKRCIFTAHVTRVYDVNEGKRRQRSRGRGTFGIDCV